MIEFLITEKLVTPRNGWQEKVEKGRQSFQKHQLRAAVRQDPDTVMAFLRDEGLLDSKVG